MAEAVDITGLDKRIKEIVKKQRNLRTTINKIVLREWRVEIG
jgi:hypothetical protein